MCPDSTTSISMCPDSTTTTRAELKETHRPRYRHADVVHREHFLGGGSAEEETALAHEYKGEHEDQRGHPYHTRGHGDG